MFAVGSPEVVHVVLSIAPPPMPAELTASVPPSLSSARSSEPPSLVFLPAALGAAKTHAKARTTRAIPC